MGTRNVPSHSDLLAGLQERRVLAVDDTEPNLVLLERIFTRAGLRAFRSCSDPAQVLQDTADFEPDLVLLDLHMPQIDGFAVLESLRERFGPERLPVIVITADQTGPPRDRALGAGANDFLTKPIDQTEVLLRSANLLRARLAHLRLAELLETTLAASVEVLLEVLSLASPGTFARASRLQQVVRDLGAATGAEQIWPAELAAGLSQLGAVTLDEDLARRVANGSPVTPEERRRIEQVPQVSLRLLERIPQLDAVLAAFDGVGRRADDPSRPPSTEARMLRIALDLEELETRGMERAEAVELLRSRPGQYDPTLLDALVAEPGDGGGPIETTLNRVVPGARLVEDLRDREGRLLIARGQVLTERVLQLLRGAGRLDPESCVVVEQDVVVAEQVQA